MLGSSQESQESDLLYTRSSRKSPLSLQTRHPKGEKVETSFVHATHINSSEAGFAKVSHVATSTGTLVSLHIARVES